jgi:hypothetical protein
MRLPRVDIDIDSRNCDKKDCSVQRTLDKDYKTDKDVFEQQLSVFGSVLLSKNDSDPMADLQSSIAFYYHWLAAVTDGCWSLMDGDQDI